MSYVLCLNTPPTPCARGEEFNEQQRRKGYLSNVTFWCPFPPILQKKLMTRVFFINRKPRAWRKKEFNTRIIISISLLQNIV